ncbi:hypothetical protein, partial [Vibrio vulnificus]|uniref:hypothetical protein n=1 Tax=Vibrio vulnificus TaxID=672 RepID=UPI0039B69F05
VSQENSSVKDKEISFETLPLKWSAQTGPFAVDYACLVEHVGCKPRPLVKISDEDSLMLCAGLSAKSSECQEEIQAVKQAQALGFVQVAENAF